MKVSIQVEVQKEVHEVGVAVAGLLKAIKAKKPIQEIIASEFASVSAAVAGIDQIPAEFAEDKAAFLRGVMLPMADVADELLKKDAPVPAA